MLFNSHETELHGQFVSLGQCRSFIPAASFLGVSARAVRDNPLFLFVTVADECDWATEKGKVHDGMLNDPALLQLRNHLTLLVSATPFNVLTKSSRIPKKLKAAAGAEHPHPKSHVVEWFPPRKVRQSVACAMVHDFALQAHPSTGSRVVLQSAAHGGFVHLAASGYACRRGTSLVTDEWQLEEIDAKRLAQGEHCVKVCESRFALTAHTDHCVLQLTSGGRSLSPPGSASVLLKYGAASSFGVRY